MPSPRAPASECERSGACLSIREGEHVRFVAYDRRWAVRSRGHTRLAVSCRSGEIGRVASRSLERRTHPRPRSIDPAAIAEFPAHADPEQPHRDLASSRCCVRAKLSARSSSPGSCRSVQPRAQIALLETFADQAVIAIENAPAVPGAADRTQELARSVDELQALGEVSQAVSLLAGPPGGADHDRLPCRPALRRGRGHDLRAGRGERHVFTPSRPIECPPSCSRRVEQDRLRLSERQRRRAGGAAQAGGPGGRSAAAATEFAPSPPWTPCDALASARCWLSRSSASSGSSARS